MPEVCPEHNELVSIIIPTFNREGSIEACVRSVLNQTYQNLEVLIVDDGSTDNTYEVVSHIDDERVHYMTYGRNKGACFARNYGIKKSKGVYFAFQDSDDEWLPEKIAHQLNLLEESHADAVFSAYIRRYENGGDDQIVPSENFKVRPNFYGQCLASNPMGTITLLCKKASVGDVCFDTNLRRFQDWDYCLQLAKKCTIAYCAEPLAIAHLNSSGITSSVPDFEALQGIWNKYRCDIESDNYAHKRFTYLLGKSSLGVDRSLARSYLKSSLTSGFSVKALLYYFYSFVMKSEMQDD